MAASPTAAVPSPKTNGGNALAALLAAAAASMHRQQQQQNGFCKVAQSETGNLNKNKIVSSLCASNSKRPATARSTANSSSAATHATQGTATTNKSRNKNNSHKLSTSSSSSISTYTDKDSANAAKLLFSLVNGNSSKQHHNHQQQQQPDLEASSVRLRNLETWHDEDEGPLEDGCLEELVDPSNSNGWSADEMFKFNEKMHKITSSYNEKTLSNNYTTPLPKINSRTTMKLVNQLAKEIEDRVIAEGRITPESSDDDELFEAERLRRVQLKQHKPSDQLKNLQRHSQQNRYLNNQGPYVSNAAANNSSSKATNKSSSQYSNSTETPATASLSSSPTLNDTIIKPVTSSSRNILRTCLT